MINLLKSWFKSEVDLDQKAEDDVRSIDSYKKEKTNYDGIFDNIYGHDNLKVLFLNALDNKNQIHILLSGAAGTAKSLFLEAIDDNVKHTHYIDNNSTGAGIIKYLYEHPNCRFLMIDEVEKLKKDEMAVLLNLMETGRLVITKANLQCNRKQVVSVFATCNNKHKLAPEMLSRFLRLHLKPYTYPEFHMITKNLATKKYKRTMEFADRVANTVWKDMGSRDIRDAMKLMKLCKNIDQIELIARTLKDYSEENAQEQEKEEDDYIQ
jgi:holliday junction DNA helicase RuvB